MVPRGGPPKMRYFNPLSQSGTQRISIAYHCVPNTSVPLLAAVPFANVRKGRGAAVGSATSSFAQVSLRPSRGINIRSVLCQGVLILLYGCVKALQNVKKRSRVLLTCQFALPISSLEVALNARCFIPKRFQASKRLTRRREIEFRKSKQSICIAGPLRSNRQIKRLIVGQLPHHHSLIDGVVGNHVLRPLTDKRIKLFEAGSQSLTPLPCFLMS